MVADVSVGSDEVGGRRGGFVGGGKFAGRVGNDGDTDVGVERRAV